jgi:hypothetical protein
MEAVVHPCCHLSSFQPFLTMVVVST